MMFWGSMIHKYIQFLCISDRFLFPFHGALPKKKTPQDITGEAPFMKTSAEMYDAKAKENKALRLE